VTARTLAMKMKNEHIIALLLILMTSIIVSQSVTAQQSQNSYTANLTYLTVQLSYPSQVLPGDSVTANLQATAKSSINSVSLTAQILYTTGADLHQLASATVSNNYMAAGNSLTKQIQFTVPQNASRTSLIAVLTEKAQTIGMSYYYYYPEYNNYSSPYCYTDPYYGYDCYYNSSIFSYYYPSYTSTTTTDSAVAPFSYIKATTPEYVTLQSQDQALQQQLNQSKSQNQQLNQNLENAQATIAQRDATIASLKQQMNSTQSTNTTVEVVAAVLGVFAIVFAGVAAREHRGKSEPRTKTTTETQTKS
jgi:hypothetical protein